MKPLTNFHHKVLRGILRLGPVSPIAPLYFLLGELPMEAFLHLDALGLFWCIWANPQTKVHEIVKYLLMMADSSSLTLTAHIRILFQLYNLPDPLALMNTQPWSKEKWKVLTRTSVTSYYEQLWRKKAATNSKLNFLNVQVTGLSGRQHPVLSGLLTTQEVTRSRVHIKMLAGDYPCSAYLATDRLQDPSCQLCQSLFPHYPSPAEDMVHLLARCRATADTRTRILPDFFNIISKHFPSNAILDHPNQTHLTQLILDPTSLNLPMSIRVSPDHPALYQILAVCRNICYAIHQDRNRQLSQIKKRVRDS